MSILITSLSISGTLGLSRDIDKVQVSWDKVTVLLPMWSFLETWISSPRLTFGFCSPQKEDKEGVSSVNRSNPHAQCLCFPRGSRYKVGTDSGF